MNDKVFVDTNILVYAYDTGETEKSRIARSLVKEIWEQKNGVISTQVLHEFYVTLSRKVKPPFRISVARGIVSRYFTWRVIINDLETLTHALQIEEEHRFSFWDSLIIAAALKAGACKLITEDLDHGRKIDNLVITNPWLA